jgi:hypothetical protein
MSDTRNNCSTGLAVVPVHKATAPSGYRNMKSSLAGIGLALLASNAYAQEPPAFMKQIYPEQALKPAFEEFMAVDFHAPCQQIFLGVKCSRSYRS